MEQPPRREDAALYITVSDPVQHSEGMNKYTSYRVDVRGPGLNMNIVDAAPNQLQNSTQQLPPQPQPPNPQQPSNNSNNNDIFQNSGYTAVLRRYSDFLWLHERLQKERAGAIIPPLPEKQAVARFSAAFIEDRRANLERFLRRLAVHPELRDAPSLDTFLCADDATFHAAKHAKGAVTNASVTQQLSMSTNMSVNMNHNMNMSASSYNNPPSIYPTLSAPPPKKDGLKKWFAETKTSIAGDLVRSPDDDLFEEIERYIESLEKQMKNISNQASSLVRKGREMANGLFEFGHAFTLLGQSEVDALGSALTQMGQTADALSALSAEHAEQETIRFEEPLADYVRTIASVKTALQKRKERRLTYTSCLSEVNTKQANLARLRATPGMEAKAYGAEMSLRRGQDATEAARDAFATVSQRILREVDRFKREKADDMRRTVMDYIQIQIDYNQKMENIWTNLLPQLEAVQNNNNNNNNNTLNINHSQEDTILQPQPPTTVEGSNSNPDNSIQQAQSTVIEEDTSNNYASTHANGAPIIMDDYNHNHLNQNNPMAGSVQYRNIHSLPGM
eukprot:CAMPEP_0184862294 /NCGR_PEP_ID=MMETSP0580-20130426/6769_1 /TAXON_ID=1118495 /ORGANISM="Dactyliosolen fragilissimus" /LENGTH=562 /DNA_ID=CAMNT_0027360081 /DNA_START=119 /DNA_END=1807 /DNA_ORIENTATION=+